MSAEIIEFPVNATRTIPEIPRKRVFYLGPHGYSAGPGLSWCTEYWVKRIQRGAAWEIYCTNPEETGRQRVWTGEYSPESLREYFDDVGFEMADGLWWEMGWRPSHSADVEDFGWYYFEKYPELFCAICGDMMGHNPFEIHECEDEEG